MYITLKTNTLAFGIIIIIVIDVRHRFSIGTGCNTNIYWDNIVYQDKFYSVIEIQVLSLSHSPILYVVQIY